MSEMDKTEHNPSLKRKRGWGWILILLLIGIGLAVGYTAYQSDMKQLAAELDPLAVSSTEPEETEIINADATTARLEARIDALESHLHALSLANAVLPEMADRLEALESHLETLQVPATSTLALNEMTAMRKELSELKTTVSTQALGDNRKARLILAYDRLKERVLSGEPYDHALQALRLASDNDVAILDTLESLALDEYSGLPTQRSLEHGLKAAIERYHSEPSDEPQSLLDEVRQNVSQLVRIRKVGSQHKGAEPDARIARAEAAFLDGDLDGAINELEELESADEAYFEDWLDRAQRFQSAKRLLATLELAVNAVLEKKTELPVTEAPVAVPAEPQATEPAEEAPIAQPPETTPVAPLIDDTSPGIDPLDELPSSDSGG
jgi:hypothetical protein